MSDRAVGRTFGERERKYYLERGREREETGSSATELSLSLSPHFLGLPNADVDVDFPSFLSPRKGWLQDLFLSPWNGDEGRRLTSAVEVEYFDETKRDGAS